MCSVPVQCIGLLMLYCVCSVPVQCIGLVILYCVCSVPVQCIGLVILYCVFCACTVYWVGDTVLCVLCLYSVLGC